MNQRGQALTEYVLATTFGMMVLFTPFVGGKSIFLLLIEAFDIYLNSFHAVIALPIP